MDRFITVLTAAVQ